MEFPFDASVAGASVTQMAPPPRPSMSRSCRRTTARGSAGHPNLARWVPPIYLPAQQTSAKGA
jgi:hypothetical protein